MQRLTRSSSSAVSLMLLITVALVGSVGAAVAIDTGLELRNGVVVDLDGGTIYAMSAEGGIDAVSLEFGTVSWHSDSAARPLAVADGHLLAQAESRAPGVLGLVVLDDSGRAIQQTSVELPPGVVARIDDDLTGQFELRAAEAEGVFEVSWRSTGLAPRGALILDEAARPQVDSGAFSFDPRTAQIRNRPKPIDGAAVAAVTVPEDERLQAVPGRQFFSGSRNQILSSEALSDPVPGGPAYRWTVYGLGGDRLGQIESPTAYAPFVVTSSLILFETHPRAWRDNDEIKSEPLTLRALALDSGLEQWNLELRDTKYRGPFPP